MISDLKSIQPGFGPPPPTMAAANTAANHPDSESIHLLAKKMASTFPGGFRPASPPGLGGSLDLYDSAGHQAAGLLGGKRPDSMGDMMKGKGDYAQGLSTTSEPLASPPDFPYLKPLSGPNLGNKLNALI